MTGSADMDDAGRSEQGMAVRREVLGADYVAGAEERSDAFTEPFQDLITRYAWGEIWSRPGLDRRSRSLVTLAVLTALGPRPGARVCTCAARGETA